MRCPITGYGGIIRLLCFKIRRHELEEFPRLGFGCKVELLDVFSASRRPRRSVLMSFVNG